MDSSEGLLQLSIINAESRDETFTDASVYLLSRSAPAELVTRLDDLWYKTQDIGGELVNIGRIIVCKIVDFVRANPNMVIGIAIGAAAGFLVNVIPFIGPLLAPLAMTAGAVIGAFTGVQMDSNNPNASMFENAITVAKAFFCLLAEVFQSIATYWNSRG
jgi:hypothetical protein